MRIKFDDKVFVYRVAGVATHGERVLIHRAETENFWALPGGACEFNEDSKTALKREFKEELNAEIEVGQLLWVVENFFSHEGKSWHEIGLYYHVSFIGNAAKLYEKEQFEGVESFFRENEDVRLFYRWFSLDKLSVEDIRPKFLRSALLNVPKQTEIILNRS